MQSYEIRAALLAKNVRLSDKARSLGVSRPTVSQIVYRKSRSARIEVAIASTLGLPVFDVFPDHKGA